MCVRHKCLYYSLEKWQRKQLVLLPKQKEFHLTSGERISQINLKSTGTSFANLPCQRNFPSVSVPMTHKRSILSSYSDIKM